MMQEEGVVKFGAFFFPLDSLNNVEFTEIDCQL